MSTKWRYVDQLGYHTLTEEEIIDFYWVFWSSKMTSKYGESHPEISESNCIKDWIISYDAWRVNDEQS